MILIHSLKDHDKHKPKLLDLIKLIPDIPINSKEDNILKSDWFIRDGFKREYWVYFFNLLIPFHKEIHKQFDGRFVIGNYWFQQYVNNNTHDWHNHPHCHLSSVYFLELPDKELLTEFKNGMSYEAKEGDIITFPSHLFHKSPLNKTNKRKTVIAFNSNML